MNKSYCDEISENLTKFVTEGTFVGYTIKERRGKQTIAFLAVTWFTICLQENFLLFAFVSTSHWQPFKITSLE